MTQITHIAGTPEQAKQPLLVHSCDSLWVLVRGCSTKDWICRGGFSNASSISDLKQFREGAIITLSCKEFHESNTPRLQLFDRTFSLCLVNFNEPPPPPPPAFVAVYVETVKVFPLTSSLMLFMILKTSIRSALSLLYSSDGSPRH